MRSARIIFFKAIAWVLIFLYHGTGMAQSPNWQWAKGAAGNLLDVSYASATDAGGNTFVAGTFTSPTISFGSVSLTNAGQSDIYLVKYNATGQLLWARSFGGTQIDWVFSLSLDKNNNLYMAGYYASPVLTFGTIPLANAGGNDVYLAKLDTAGNTIWATTAGGSGYESASCVTDAGDNVYLAGGFNSSSITFGTHTLTHSGGFIANMFLVKYDANGTALWAKSAYSDNNVSAVTIAPDAYGHLYVGGYFQGSYATLGPITLTNSVPAPGWGYSDMFLAKYDAATGLEIWAKSAGGDYAENITSLTLDAQGNLYIAGGFGSPVMTIDTITLTNADTANGFQDMFLVRYDTSGSAVWGRSAGNILDDNAGVFYEPVSGHLIVTGSFGGPSITLGTYVLSSAGQYDVFLACYDLSGNTLWANAAGGADDEFPYSSSHDAAGNIYVAGFSRSNTVTFGSVVLTNAGGGGDPFLVKWGNATSGINDPTALVFNIYPNPAKETLYISGKAVKDADITIYDAVGRTVYYAHSSAEFLLINTTDIAPGVYHARVTSTAGATIKSFVKR